MKVSEIFYSIQGEGTNMGKPAVFLRLALCNLRCVWCDTKYTWDWENYDYEREVREMPVRLVRELILQYGCDHLVVTGGEPMLQQKEVARLLGALGNFYVELETNGTILPDADMTSLVSQWNVSPKLENSGNPTYLRERRESYLFFRNLPNAYFKYVIQKADDSQEVQHLARKYELPPDRIILMPEATKREELEERSKWLIEECKKLGYRFTSRLQVELWGNRRGV